MAGRAGAVGRSGRGARDERSLVARVVGFFTSLVQFFSRVVWEETPDRLPAGKAVLYQAGRVAYSTVRGFSEDRLTFRAAALTYFSVLSIVPFLAFAFSVLKGFGAYAHFIDQVVTPYVSGQFGENPALKRAIEQVFDFVGRTNVSGLGISGLVFLAYTAISMLTTIESVLNDLWEVREGRRFFRRVTDYVTLVVVTPMLILVAITFGTAAQSSGVMVFLRETMALGPVIDLLMRLTSFIGACLAMTAVFLIMPNTRVRVISALMGGIVGGALWQTALILHVNFQRGVAQYNALYSGFAALPIFLVWIYVSWLAVLVGGEVAASHQNDQTARQRLRARQVDEAFKEKLAVAVMGRVARAFLDAAPRPSTEQLVCELQAPPQTIDEVAGRLIDQGLLVATGKGPERTYVPGRDLDTVRIHELVNVLRHCHPPDRNPGEELAGPPAINGLMQALDDVVARSEANLTLRQLAELVPPPEETQSAGATREPQPMGERLPPAAATPHQA